MNSIFFALSEEINHPELSEYIIEAEYDFAKGAFKTGMSNLKAIREMFVQENIPKNLIEALDAFIKAINGKKFEDTKTARKTIEKIMKAIYPVSEEENSEEDSDSQNEDTEKEDSEEDDSDEEMLDLEDAIEKYNKLLKNKVLNKYIVAKRFKITNDIDEDEEKREMIYALYKVIKNIYENFSSEKDSGDILDVLEELDEITDMI